MALPTVTIGVSIPVPEPYGGLLRDKRAEFGDPMAETVPSHVTLVPPTEVSAADLDSVCEALDRVATPLQAFPMRLRGTGTFRPVSPVVFVAVSLGISSTEVLADSIRSALDIAMPAFPFHPHVTVAQNLDDESLDRAYEGLRDFECEFTVEEFALYCHDAASGWVPKHTFDLGAGPAS